MQTTRSDFTTRRVGHQVGGADGKTAAMDPGSRNDSHVPRSVILRVRQDVPWADSARIPQIICPARVVIYVHASHQPQVG